MHSFARFACFGIFIGVAGCSTDGTATSSTDAAASHKGSGGAASGTGGSTSTGGSISTGGQKTAADCPADSGTESCRQCLAINCCSDYQKCENDSACAKALETYRECADKTVSAEEKTICYSAFGQTMRDAGASSGFGAAIGLCVIGKCIVCGSPHI